MKAMNADSRGTEDRSHGAELGGAVKVADLLIGARAELLDEEQDHPLHDQEEDEDDGELG